MKKNIMVILASALCFIMLTACSGNEGQTMRSVNFGEKRDLSAVAAYDFNTVQRLEVLKQNESQAYKLYKQMLQSDTIYYGLEYADGGLEMFFAKDEANNYVSKFNMDGKSTAAYYDGTAITIYTSDSTEAYRTTDVTDTNINSDLDISAIAGDFFSNLKVWSENDYDTIYTYDIFLDDNKYTYEIYTSGGYCFDEDGYLCKIDTANGSFLIHDFVFNVPTDAFVQPEGYTISNLEE